MPAKTSSNPRVSLGSSMVGILIGTGFLASGAAETQAVAGQNKTV
jgi:hypothetical protein